MVTAAKGKASEINFGSLDFYTSGGGLSEGDYVWKDLTIQMYQYPERNGKQSPARLGVVITMSPLKGGEDIEQFYGFGTKAHESFQPNPETGKTVVVVPGGPASSFNNMTKWALLLKSLYDSGLPQGVFTNDVSVLEGIHVHMANVPEPPEWSSFQSKTGEVAEERKAGTVAVVTEIKDEGKPWEGGGGVPEAAPQTAGGSGGIKTGNLGKGSSAPTAKAPVKAPAKAAPAAPPEEGGNEALYAAAISAISTVLEKNPKGCPKLVLRTSVFKAVKEAENAETAGEVVNTYFADDVVISGILGELGFTLKGTQVLPS